MPEPGKKPFEERRAAFVEEYGKLVERHGVDFVQYPMFVPDKEGGWRVVLQTAPIDKDELPVKSPFIPDAQ